MTFLHADLLAGTPFSDAERQLATGLAEHLDVAARKTDPVPFAAAWLLYRARQGASCIDLDQTPAWPTEWENRPEWPSRAGWENLVSDDHKLLGEAGCYRPVIIENGKLYLHRYRTMEETLAMGLKALAVTREPAHATLDLLNALFDRNTQAGMIPDRQKHAVYGALRRRFSVITGGPGTGKTTCVLNLLAALLTENPRLSIALAAPTGKAAARLNESIAKGITRLNAAPVPGLEPALLDKIPGEARTLHKLLGITPATPEGNPRAPRHLSSADVVVVDEASMIPLPLMTTLVRSLAPNARLVLLGDRDQLASVDLGSVLGDIIAAADTLPPSPGFMIGCTRLDATPPPKEIDLPPVSSLTDAVHRLTHTYRFKREEVVGCFCLALQDGKPAQAIQALDQFGALAPAPSSPTELRRLVAQAVRENFAHLGGLADPVNALDALNRFRLLASHRVGPYGVVEINRLAHLELKHRPGDHFSGLPLMITVNTPDLDLWNGDCGILLRDPATDLLLAWFPSAPGQPPRSFAPAKLPEWEPAFAMSIHKSQGSEFDAVTLVLPPEDAPLLTRELLYTGASRAKTTLTVHAPPALLQKALARTVTRPSGLAARLR